MNKKKPILHNKEITAHYIHWASKFATMIIKHKQTADYIHWASKIATSANKHAVISLLYSIGFFLIHDATVILLYIYPE